MKDRYRRLLSTYRKPSGRAQDEFTLKLDEEKASVLLEFVDRLLRTPTLENSGSERRGKFRRPYPRAMLMTPCSAERDPAMRETTTVVGKDLSESGISFVHTRAPQFPYALLTFQLDGGAPLCLLTAIRRVQAIRQGLYLIGGNFVERIELGAVQNAAHRPGQEPLD